MPNDLLVVVDVQNGFVNGESRHIVQPLVMFLNTWLHSGRPAVVTRFFNPPNSKWDDLLDWHDLRQSPDTDLVSELTAVIAPFTPSQVLVSDKTSYTALTSEVAAHVARLDATNIFVCGIATEACVLKTAVDVFEHEDLRPFIVTDLCASTAGEAVHDAGLMIAEGYIGPAQFTRSEFLCPLT